MVDVSKAKVFEGNKEVAEAKVSQEGFVSISDMIAEAEAAIAAMPQIAGNTRTSNGICSVGVVNSKNGKRITFSKALCLKLGLTDKVNVLPNIKTSELIVASRIASPRTCRGKLSGEANEKKICYNSNMVALITMAFGLDFSEHVSRSFSNIRFVEEGETIYAFVTMGNPEVEKIETTVEDEDNVEEVTED